MKSGILSIASNYDIMLDNGGRMHNYTNRFYLAD